MGQSQPNFLILLFFGTTQVAKLVWLKFSKKTSIVNFRKMNSHDCFRKTEFFVVVWQEVEKNYNF